MSKKRQERNKQKRGPLSLVPGRGKVGRGNQRRGRNEIEKGSHRGGTSFKSRKGEEKKCPSASRHKKEDEARRFDTRSV